MAVPKHDRRQPDSSIIVIQHPFLGIQYSVKCAVRQAWLSDWQDVLCQRRDCSVTTSAKTDRSIRISDRNRLRSKNPNLLQKGILCFYEYPTLCQFYDFCRLFPHAVKDLICSGLKNQRSQRFQRRKSFNAFIYSLHFAKSQTDWLSDEIKEIFT